MTTYRLHYRLSCGCGLTTSVEGATLEDARSLFETEIEDPAAVYKWSMSEDEYNQRGAARHAAFVASGGSYVTEPVAMTPALEAHLRDALQHREQHELICKVPGRRKV